MVGPAIQRIKVCGLLAVIQARPKADYDRPWAKLGDLNAFDVVKQARKKGFSAGLFGNGGHKNGEFIAAKAHHNVIAAALIVIAMNLVFWGIKPQK